MKAAAASGLAFLLALGSATAARAQVSGTLTLATDYRIRGVSLTDRRGAAVASLAYDHDSGVYAGASLVAHDPVEHDVRVLGWQAYAGVAGRLASGPAWDIGVNRVEMGPYFDRRYDLEYTEVHVGLAQGPLAGRLSLASGYPRKDVDTLYAELNGTIRPADAWRVTGHVGLQSRLNQRRADEADERLDVTLAVARTFSNRAEAQLSWTVLTPRPEPHVTWTRPGLTASVSVFF